MMARIRSIKPGYNKSPDIAPILSIPCRLHFALLWTYADDEGRGLDDPLNIKGELWPRDREVDEEQIEEWQEELALAGRIVRYENEGRRFFEVAGFRNHQKPNKPMSSALPAPSESTPVALPEHYGSPTEPLPPVVVVGVGEEQEQGNNSPASRDETITAAIDLLLRRDGSVELSRSKQNPSGWLNAARNGRQSDHWQAACKAWTAGMSAETLADILEPPAVNPSARLAEYVAEQEPVDLKEQAERIRRMKAERESA